MYGFTPETGQLLRFKLGDSKTSTTTPGFNTNKHLDRIRISQLQTHEELS